MGNNLGLYPTACTCTSFTVPSTIAASETRTFQSVPSWLWLMKELPWKQPLCCLPACFSNILCQWPVLPVSCIIFVCFSLWCSLDMPGSLNTQTAHLFRSFHGLILLQPSPALVRDSYTMHGISGHFDVLYCSVCSGVWHYLVSVHFVHDIGGGYLAHSYHCHWLLVIKKP